MNITHISSPSPSGTPRLAFGMPSRFAKKDEKLKPHEEKYQASDGRWRIEDGTSAVSQLRHLNREATRLANTKRGEVDSATIAAAVKAREDYKNTLALPENQRP